MNLKLIAETLQNSEIILLRALSKARVLDSHKRMSNVEFMRSAMYLNNKKLVRILKSERKVVTLLENGIEAAKKSLPELILADVLKKQSLTFKRGEKLLGPDKFRFAVGYLRSGNYVRVEKGIIHLTSEGKKLKTTPEMDLIQKLNKSELNLAKLSAAEKVSFLSLSKRKKVVGLIKRTEYNVKITALGEEILNNLPKIPGIEANTPTVIRSGIWKSRKFRRYDVEAPVPDTNLGKKQPYMQFLDDIRMKMVELGFKEMSGPIIETEFNNFDALYQPQNHPARKYTDVYKLKNPKNGKLPNKRFVDAVKAAHENGGKTGSKGWQYSWSDKISKQLMPRSHTTSVSARQMMKGVDIPGKYFTVGRVFRPDVLDSTHLIEFNQLEGIIIDKNLSFANLLGTLKKFAIEVSGAKKVRFIPDYFPFTEPSVQMDVWSEKLNKWVEFGGAGIFRPELTETLGIKEPVIAWGLGIDRMFMQKIGSRDIRELFANNIAWLRKQGAIV